MQTHAINSLVVMATLQECTLSDYEFVYLARSRELKTAVCMVTPSEYHKESWNGGEIHHNTPQTVLQILAALPHNNTFLAETKNCPANG